LFSKGLPLEQQGDIKEVPLTLLIPHLRMQLKTINFYQIAKLVYFLALVGCKTHPDLKPVIKEHDFAISKTHISFN
jgi:hypothetical protein